MQLKIAQNKVKGENVEFICCSAENIPLPDNSIDVIVSTWVLGTIQEVGRRNKVIEEMKRVLKEKGKIFLVENDIGGEFETIRNRYPNIERTKKYNDWIENKGFIVYNKFETFFEFLNKMQARDVFLNIWGKDVGNKIESEKIMQKIVIYKYEK